MKDRKEGLLPHLLYYDMKLVTFGIDDQRNLIVQFPVFVHPQGQQCLILYQLETVPVPIVDKNEQAQSYTQVQTEKPYIALNSQTIYLSENTRTGGMQENWL